MTPHFVLSILLAFKQRFGASCIEEDILGFRFGVWNEERVGTSSNYQYFRNFVETLEDLGKKKGTDRREVFLCTDNMVSEIIATEGSSRFGNYV